MNATRKTYCLVLAANPCPEVAVVRCDDEGRPVTERTYRTYGPRIDPSSGQYAPNKAAGTKPVVGVYFARHVGGTFNADAASVTVLDPTPRTFEEAMGLADRCPKGTHTGPSLTADAARAVLAGLRPPMAAPGRECHALDSDGIEACLRPVGHDGEHIGMYGPLR